MMKISVLLLTFLLLLPVVQTPCLTPEPRSLCTGTQKPESSIEARSRQVPALLGVWPEPGSEVGVQDSDCQCEYIEGYNYKESYDTFVHHSGCPAGRGVPTKDDFPLLPQVPKKFRKNAKSAEKEENDIPPSHPPVSFTSSPSDSLSQGQRRPSESRSHRPIRSPSESISQRQRRSPSDPLSQRSWRSPSESISQRRRRSPSESISQRRRRSPSESISQRRRRSPSESISQRRRRSPSDPLSQRSWRSPSESISQRRRRRRSPSLSILRRGRRSPSLSISQRRRSTGEQTSTTKLKTSSFPLSEERFQKKALQLLIDIRDSIKIATGSTEGTAFQINPANTQTEFQELESRLADENERAALRAHLKRLGGVDEVDMVKKSMAVTLSNALMAKMSMKGKCGKLPFSKSLLCQTICDAVINTYQTTETKVMETMSKYLKYAPERLGGGGRKKTVI